MRSTDNENTVERNRPRMDKFHYGDCDEKRYFSGVATKNDGRKTVKDNFFFKTSELNFVNSK